MVRSAPPEKALLAGGEDRALDRGVIGDRVGDRRHLGDHFRRQHVHRAAGHIPGDERNAVGVGLETEIREGHECDLRLKVRRVR